MHYLLLVAQNAMAVLLCLGVWVADNSNASLPLFWGVGCDKCVLCLIFAQQKMQAIKSVRSGHCKRFCCRIFLLLLFACNNFFWGVTSCYRYSKQGDQIRRNFSIWEKTLSKFYPNKDYIWAFSVKSLLIKHTKYIGLRKCVSYTEYLHT
jgi:hypothetical protein